MTNTKTPSALNRFKDLIGSQNVLTDQNDMDGYLHEWRDKYIGQAAAVLRPGSVSDVAGIAKIAHEEKVALVPQGGNTGLVGGQIAFDQNRQFVVSLSRLNSIRHVDATGYTITVDAGVILENVQNAADNVDRLFPLRIGSQGSCQIGGNLSSNAGGTGVLAYGNSRDLVLGVEVVLPNGEILNGLNKLRKNNTGYDLQNLFIGAEGTLGFITGAVLKLYPKPRGQQVAFLGFETLDQVASFFITAKSHAGGMLTAFEIMPRIGIDFLIKHVAGARDPVSKSCPWYGLIEVSSGQSENHANALMMDMVEEGLAHADVTDGTIAASRAQSQAFWHLRHELSGCQKPEGGSIKHDVSVPVAHIPEFMKEATAAVIDFMPGCRPVPFGHWGDGNIHLNISQPVDMERDVFLNQWDAVNDIVHAVALTYGGSISAEHGIGVMKRDKLALVKDPVALSVMHQIKQTLDPHNIMNPGKVLQQNG